MLWLSIFFLTPRPPHISGIHYEGTSDFFVLFFRLHFVETRTMDVWTGPTATTTPSTTPSVSRLLPPFPFLSWSSTVRIANGKLFMVYVTERRHWVNWVTSVITIKEIMCHLLDSVSLEIFARVIVFWGLRMRHYHERLVLPLATKIPDLYCPFPRKFTFSPTHTRLLEA